MKTLNFLLVSFLLTFSTLSNSATKSQICMAKAIYFESRGGNVKDMTSIGHVVMNRVKNKHYPSSVCSVTRQKWQFSPNIRSGAKIRERNEWRKSLKYAKRVMNGQRDFTGGATHFHNYTMTPYWAKRNRIVHRNKQHVFYKLL